MRIPHPNFHALRFKKGCRTTFTSCTTLRRMHMMWWISRHITQRLQRMYGGAQTLCLLWMVPSHPWGGVICIPPSWPSVSQSRRLISVWWDVLPNYGFLWCFHFSHYQVYACRQGPWYWLWNEKSQCQSIIHAHWRQQYQKIETLCKEDEFIMAFEAYFILPI